MNRMLIVIVNYRSAGLTLDCLASLAAAEIRPGRRVVVVENASGDDSAARLAAAVDAYGWGGWCRLLPLDRNLGFAGGNNAALRPALAGPQPPDSVLLLNPDTVVRPGAISALEDFLDSHPRVGLAGSRLEDPDGTPQRSAFRFPTVLSELEGGLRFGPVSQLLAPWVVAPPVSDRPHRTDWMAGASLLVRREVFDRIGLLDEGYFLYFEETDFCLRAARAGWPGWYVPASRVVHLVGQSSGVTDTKRPARRMPRYWFESRRRYFAVNHGRMYAALADAAYAAGFSLWRVRRWLQSKPDTDPPHLLGDFLRFSLTTPL